MAFLPEDHFTASIPAQAPGTRVHYYIEATSNDGRKMRKPMVAPEWAYNFVIDEDASTEVNSHSSGITAKEISLSQNFPNPFNHTTRIDYSLPESNEVEISVYDLSGQRIRILVREFATRGQAHRQVGRIRSGDRHLSVPDQVRQLRGREAGHVDQVRNACWLRLRCRLFQPPRGIGRAAVRR